MMASHLLRLNNRGGVPTSVGGQIKRRVILGFLDYVTAVV